MAEVAISTLSGAEGPAVDAVRDVEALGPVNRRELATLLGVSEPTITSMVERGMPVLKRGKSGQSYEFDHEECKAWVEAERAEAEAARVRREGLVQEALDLQGGASAFDEIPLAQRRQYFEAERVRMTLAIQRGEYVSAARVRRDYEQTLSWLAEQLQGLPDHLERSCDLSPDIVHAVIARVDEWQGELQRRLRELPDEEDEDSDRALAA